MLPRAAEVSALANAINVAKEKQIAWVDIPDFPDC